MNETLLTISLLTIVACNLGVLWLWFTMNRRLPAKLMDKQGHLNAFMRTIDDIGLVLNRLSEAADRQRGMKQALLEDGKITRQRIAQVKTRLADEEAEDQRAKAAARRKGVRS